MAESVTATEVTHGSVKKLTFAWTSAADGTATGASTEPYNGEILGFATIPDGTAAPTDNYDVQVQDADGHDVLLGAGADRDTANTEYVDRASLAAVAGSKLTLEVSNAGDTKQGTVILWIR